MTATRDAHRQQLIEEDPDELKEYEYLTNTAKRREDYEAPIHFEEFEVIDEEELK